MAKIQNPYVCDECGTNKKPSNGWFLGLSDSSANIIISPWDDSMADKEEIRHLCGIDCCVRFVAKELGRYNAAPKAAETTA